jgi:hypothetical protein
MFQYRLPSSRGYYLVIAIIVVRTLSTSNPAFYLGLEALILGWTGYFPPHSYVVSHPLWRMEREWLTPTTLPTWSIRSRDVLLDLRCLRNLHAQPFLLAPTHRRTTLALLTPCLP